METAGSIITSLGAGSGIDMAKLASDLAAAQFQQKAARLTARGELVERQISAAATLKNALATLASSLGDRVRGGDLAAVPQVADAAVARASVPFGTTGRGSYSLEVTQLARAQVLASPPVADAAAPLGAGTLTIRFGTVGQGAFTPDPARAGVDIAIAADATLADVAQAINGAGAGVTAYVANTVAGARLVMKGPQGEASGFSIEAGAAPAGLAALGWDPATGDSTRLLEGAADALFNLDGLAMRSASNQTGTVAPGLKLDLTGVNPGNPTQIAFSNPADAITTALQDLVGALNEIATGLKQATDPVSGDLNSDPGARALRQSLSRLAGQIVMPNAAAAAPRTLADLGLTLQRDGSFRLDTDRLAATLDRAPEGAAAMFTVGLYGVYSTFDRLAREATGTGNPGSLGGSLARYQRLSAEITEQSADLAEAQQELRATMVARFARADARIAASQSTLTFLQQQIDAWNAQGS